MSVSGHAFSPVGGRVVGAVSVLSRFPVKSTAGETVASAVVDRRGLLHDREWGAYTSDGGIASGKTTRRFRRVDGLMRWRSAMAAVGGPSETMPLLHSPDGTTYPVEDPAASVALSRAFGQPLTLRRETTVSHHDESGVHLVTTSSIRRVEELVGARIDPRRLRTNILLDTAGTGFLEDDWTGADLAVGPDVVLRLGPGMPRCVMADQPQAGVGAEPRMLRALGRAHAVLLGLQAHVVRVGEISLGDEATLMPPSAMAG